MLGHSSAAMTLDTYADLFDDDLDAVALALDSAQVESRPADRSILGEQGNTAKTDEAAGAELIRPTTASFCPL